MRCMIYEKNMSSLTLHDPDQRHGIPPPRVTVIMHRSGANAFKAAALLQLTPDSSLHLLFHTRQFSKASPDGCRFEAKWKLDSVGPVLKLISACRVCRTAVWKPRNKVWGSWSHLSDKSGGKNTCCTEFFSLFFFSPQTDNKNILDGFYGAIYSTLTSPTLSGVTEVALKAAISAAFRDEDLLCGVLSSSDPAVWMRRPQTQNQTCHYRVQWECLQISVLNLLETH